VQDNSLGVRLDDSMSKNLGSGCREHDYVVGLIVTLHSLGSRAELNGRRGILMSFAPEKHRAVIQIDGEDQPVTIKPTNIFSLIDVATDAGYRVLETMAQHQMKKPGAKPIGALMEDATIPMPAMVLRFGTSTAPKDQSDDEVEAQWEGSNAQEWWQDHRALLARASAQELASRSECLRQLHEWLREHLSWCELLALYGLDTVQQLKMAIARVKHSSGRPCPAAAPREPPPRPAFGPSKAPPTPAPLNTPAGSDPLDALMQRLEHGDPRMRCATLEDLGMLPADALSKHVGAIVRRLEDADESVRRTALEVLKEVPRETIALHRDEIEERLQHPDADVRRSALEALGGLPSKGRSISAVGMSALAVGSAFTVAHVIETLAISLAAYEEGEGLREDDGCWIRVQGGHVAPPDATPHDDDVYAPVPWMAFGRERRRPQHWEALACEPRSSFSLRLDGKKLDPARLTDESMPVEQRRRIETLTLPACAARGAEGVDMDKLVPLTIPLLRKLWRLAKTAAPQIQDERQVQLMAEQAAESKLYREYLSDEQRDAVRQAKIARIALELEGARSCTRPGVTLQPQQPDEEVMGGQARIHSLAKRDDLNGKVGTIVSYNVDGKRRFGICVDGNEPVSIKPLNLEAVDDPRRSNRAYCTTASSEVCRALRRCVEDAGSKRHVVDWTPLSEDSAMDPAHLYHMGMDSALVSAVEDTLYYVQRTAKNAAFFLTHRELMNKGTTADLPCAGVAPWLIFHAIPQSTSIVVPPASDDAGELASILQFFTNVMTPAVQCGTHEATVSIS
jgi:hypothetical protein